MTKLTGLGQQFLFSGIALSNDIQGGSWASPHQTHDVTGIDMLAIERNLALKDATMAVNAFFNPAGGRSHATFNDLPTTDQLATWQIGTVRGNHAANLVGKQVDYNGTRSPNGELLFTTNLVGNAYPVEWGRQLTAGQDLLGGAAATTGVDFTAASSFGLQAHLHVTLFTGTSATVTIQESSDNGVGDPWANVVGGAFAAASAVGWQRIQTARALTVERYLRVNVTGTFSALLFAVSVTKNLTSTVF